MAYEKETLVNVMDILSDPRKANKHGIPPFAAKGLIEFIRKVMNNGGKILEGRRTLDGYVMSTCPKHNYAPMHVCLTKCKFFNGKDIFNGVCVAKDDNYPNEPKYTYETAKRLETKYRQEKGTPERVEFLTVDEINEKLEDQDKEKEDGENKQASVYAKQTEKGTKED